MPKRKSITGNSFRKQHAAQQQQRRENEKNIHILDSRRTTAAEVTCMQETDTEATPKTQKMMEQDHEQHSKETQPEVEDKRQNEEPDQGSRSQETCADGEETKEAMDVKTRETHLLETVAQVVRTMPKTKSVTGYSSRKQQAARHHQLRENETHEETIVRRRIKAAQAQARRSQEKEAEVEQRRKKNSAQQCRIRENETKEETAGRRRTVATHDQARCSIHIFDSRRTTAAEVTCMQETDTEATPKTQKLMEPDHERHSKETQPEVEDQRLNEESDQASRSQETCADGEETKQAMDVKTRATHLLEIVTQVVRTMPKTKSMTCYSSRKLQAARHQQQRENETHEETIVRKRIKAAQAQARRSQETDSEAEQRRVKDAARKRQRIKIGKIKETTAHRRKMAANDQPRCSQEADSEAEQRRQTLHTTERRFLETDAETAQRRQEMAERAKDSHSQETDTEANERRRPMAERNMARHSYLSFAEAEERRQVAVAQAQITCNNLPAQPLVLREENLPEAEERRQVAVEQDQARHNNVHGRTLPLREDNLPETKERKQVAVEQVQARSYNVPGHPLAVREDNSRNVQRRRVTIMHNVGRCCIISEVQEHNCGSLDQECERCDALFFLGERTTRGFYSPCCHVGKVVPECIPPYPAEMRQLMDGTDEQASHFKENIRSYNSALSFASMGAQVAQPTGRGPFCLRIHGQIYHHTSHLHPAEEGQEKFAQLYILDSDSALRQRMDRRENVSCNQELMRKLDEVIRRVNPYAEAYKMLHEMEEEVIREEGIEAAQNIRMYITDKQLNSDEHKGRFNAPKSKEIAMVFRSSDGVPPSNRDICIYPKSNQLCKINTLNPNCDPMTYVLFFPSGERGWSVDRGCTELQFYSHRLSIRQNVFNPILHGGKLLQQYVVDSYVKVEANRLNYIRQNQKTLRVESYMGLADHVNAIATEAGVKPGVTVILPSTFIGSPRAMQQNFQDAMSIVREFGKPDLFLTFTCNPKWSEIKDNLLPGQKPHDRPDLVARVFDIKKKKLLEDLKKHYVLGRTVADIHVIEFQKRGLPHMHLLIILAEDDKIRDSESIDRIVCAELPDATVQDRLHEIVKSTMIHGPCGVLNPSSPCMKDGACSKGYPKQFREETAENIDGYPMYRRRDNGNHILVKGNAVDNRWVVPYNSYLTKKYNAHINVEICSSVKSIKYIFKYVYKGHDCAKVVFQNNGEGSVTWDEIKSFLDARYVSAPEGMWRLLEKTMHDKSHSIIRLPVHLPGMQPVYFIDAEERSAFESATGKCTMLTAWFQLNRVDCETAMYLYTDIPKHFVWRGNMWHKRVRLGDSIVPRMYSVSPKDIERYHLRMLLCHVRGAKSFAELRSHENIEYETFKEACRARNLLEDDGEWQQCLREACVFEMPGKLRQLFSFICVFCNPTSPLELWEEFKEELTEDFLSKYSSQQSIKLALQNIGDHLLVHNMTLGKLGLPEPANVEYSVAWDVYDLENERQEGQRLVDMLNNEQRLIFEDVMKAVSDEDVASTKAFCVSAFAGSGKSFLFNAILHTVRGMGEVAVPVAWTGIAAILLQGGRTVHSRFKLPVPVLENSSCNIRQNTEEGRFIKSAKVILWDECTMTPHHALNAVDTFLRDLVGTDVPFGGKVFILGGDWRQILPVAFHANRTLIIESCLKNSFVWVNFKQYMLVRNMRTDTDEQDFAEWLLCLGEGRLSNDCGLEEDIIEIPPECVVKDSIVDEIFGYPQIDMDNLSDTAILCPKNEDSLKLNEQVLRRVPGEMKTYFSADSIVCDDEEEQDNFQTDFINKLTPSGMPPHELNLKVGVIVMLLRNLNPSSGLCNGTRLIVRRLMSNVIDAEILTGHTRGSRVFIPRIMLTPSDTNLPFKLRRRQFPLRLAFAMTINKSQGQSLKKVGIYLPQPVFSHGMLYVAFSRATSKTGVRVSIKGGSKQGKLLMNSDRIFTRNVVFKEVLM